MNGQLYSGWASLDVGQNTAALTGYAYEASPGMPINARQTESIFRVMQKKTARHRAAVLGKPELLFIHHCFTGFRCAHLKE